MINQQKALVLGGNSSMLNEFIEDLHASGYEIHATFTQDSPFRSSIAKYFRLDVQSDESINGFLEEVATERYDLIVNGIGRTSGIQIERDSVKHVEEILRVNLIANIWLLPKLVDLMSNHGVLTFIGSSSAEGKSFDIAYSAAKAGLEAAIKSYFHTRKLNSKRIYVIQPSLVDESTMFYEMAESTVEFHKNKWNGHLLSKKNISAALIEIVKNPKQEGVIQVLRPFGYK